MMTTANQSLFIHFKNASACTASPCPAKSKEENYCCPFGNVYEEGNGGWGRFSQFPTHENMRLFLWDYRNPAVSDYLLQTRILGALGLGSPHVDGFFTDDPAGLGQEHPRVVERIGYNASEVTECKTAQVRTVSFHRRTLVILLLNPTKHSIYLSVQTSIDWELLVK